MKLNEILDKNYSEVQNLVGSIRKFHCPNCGGKGSEGNYCRYCNAENQEIVRYIEKIENILKSISTEMKENNISPKDVPINKLCNILSTLSSHKDNYIEKFLHECDYKNSLYLFLNQEINNMTHDNYELSGLTKDALENLIYMNPKDVNMEYIHKLIIRRTLLNNPPISYECFEELIIHFIEDLMHKEHQVAQVRLIPNKTFDEIDTGLEGITLGTTQGCLIRINTSGIEALYKNGNEELLDTIYHEVCHFYQNRTIEKTHGKVQLLELKDKILSEKLNGYYRENYANISFECQARYVGKKRLIMYAKQYNMYFKNNSIEKSMQQEKEKMHMTSRIINGEEVDINEYFDEFIQSKPELLQKYPILKELYEINNNMVVPIETLKETKTR